MDSHWLMRAFAERPELGEDTPGSMSETRLGGGVEGMERSALEGATRALSPRTDSWFSGTVERALLGFVGPSSRFPGLRRATERALRKGDTTGGMG